MSQHCLLYSRVDGGKCADYHHKASVTGRTRETRSSDHEQAHSAGDDERRYDIGHFLGYYRKRIGLHDTARLYVAGGRPPVVVCPIDDIPHPMCGSRYHGAPTR